MFLKSLDILGFKSFADKTHIDFVDGISALIGPNGCGKSNIVDAIKWVVGEQSARSLRADSMEEVIFNGSQNRKALSAAEVTLTVSNEAGTLGIDAQEVAIKRRVFRSGESEYFINNQTVKLKQVRELFWDTGIGKSAYSVMEQGRIDQILSSRPEDRRYLFEEAAAITRHKLRSKEAEQKLALTEDNMRQINSVLSELRKNHDTLKVQCEKTLEYRSFKDRLFEVERDIHLIRLKKFISDKETKLIQEREKNQKGAELRGIIENLDRDLAAMMDKINGLEESLVKKQRNAYGLSIEKSGKEEKRKLLEQNAHEARGTLAQTDSRTRSILDRVAKVEEQEARKHAELNTHETHLREVEASILEFEGLIRDAHERIRDNDNAIMRAESDIVGLEKTLVTARTRLDAITEDIVAQLDARLKESGYSSAERKNAEEAIHNLIAVLRTKLEGRSTLLADYARLLTQGAQKDSPGDIDNNGTENSNAQPDNQATFEKASRELGELAGMAADLEQRFVTYKGTSLAFIDEFLSPEGIITKKRSIDAEISAAEAEIAHLKAAIVERRKQSRALHDKEAEYNKTLGDMRGNKIRLQSMRTASREGLEMLRREKEGQLHQLSELDREAGAVRTKLEQTVGHLSTLDSEVQRIDREGLAIALELAQLEQHVHECKATHTAMKKTSREHIALLESMNLDLARTNTELAQIDTEIRNLKDNFVEAYSRDLGEFADIEPRPEEIGQLRNELGRLRSKLKDLGQVNLMAPEEYAEVKERYDFLINQVADLDKARADLIRVTAEIKQESSVRFLETYHLIRKNFNDIFRRLFGGGRAELKLIDEERVLESGIDILVQPPGKKLESITLLSGGEKTLTAIALLFATYLVRPSPFCFLDEIDAALDEQNVLRFVGLLREFGAHSQFVVITHNKKTIIGADAMMGITMEESGVSKLVAVKLPAGNHGGELPSHSTRVEEAVSDEGSD